MSRGQTQDAPSFATQLEVEKAIGELTSLELERIRRVANRCANALAAAGLGICGKDLIQRAIQRLWELKRKWPKQVPFVKCVIEAVRNAAWVLGKRTRNLAFVSLDGIDPGDHERPLQLADEEPRPERIVVARQKMRALEARFAKDEQVLLVIEALGSGMKGPEIQEMLNLSSTQYETVKRRLQRGLPEED